ncbi:RidA family protein [Pseudonocardia kunmingensis]|uniref:Enamine deaminase RidA (YjgF/YER057c/UK114 family) n=1 Tax=Pseudonocardia kunmingensis TaxID=630975 RepID=A0A543DQH9_9PSEU|nr:RidA family protein [Pseudonocardia kunmingensis]TQM11592.1 enamine deaminase RidA (YjgF/YER057c/UK114 family) [Pseudonocardia kunmingensis]
MHKTFISPTSIYAPTWDFSQAIKVTGGSLLFVSGIIGYRPDGTMPRGLVDQAEVAFENLQQVLAAAGGAMADIVKVNVFVGEDYRLHRDEMREVRSRFFPRDFPVSTLVQVAGFANPDYLFEIEAIAALPA